jgi:alkanesulfonate monooxygenase SsuD/methylene tetrahydromethanopterin reductase-like flavin-dependent oxidoreductase (luciferase family)
MHIIASLSGNGFHPAAWRAGGERAWPIGRHFQRMAQTAERGRLDAVLLGETPGGYALRAAGRINGLNVDPLPLAGSLIATTQRIGLGATWSLDFAEPFHVARVMATLDHLCGGRIAWAATLFDGADIKGGFKHAKAATEPSASTRRAIEFIEVVRKLWDSWEDRGFFADVPSGRFADPDRVHPINHTGDFFTVRGPLNLPRPPQGNPPIIMHDPGHPADRLVIARSADVVLTGAINPIEARIQGAAIRAAVKEQGRNPEDVRILAKLTPVLADTEADAKKLSDDLDAMASPKMMAAMTQRAGLRFTGTAEQLAHLMAQWVAIGACDGFNVRPAMLPAGLDLFVERVVPLLQARGLFRGDYQGDTLRDHLGLGHFESCYAA